MVYNWVNRRSCILADEMVCSRVSYFPRLSSLSHTLSESKEIIFKGLLNTTPFSLPLFVGTYISTSLVFQGRLCLCEQRPAPWTHRTSHAC